VLFLHGLPAGGEPELRALVAAVGDEFGEFGAGNQARGELEWLQPDAVTRALIVEAEAFALILADLDEAAGVVEEAQGRGVGWGNSIAFKVRGLERVGIEGVLDVGEEQLLVLFFVVQAEFDASPSRRRSTASSTWAR
jgi:hypothetical protein